MGAGPLELVPLAEFRRVLEVNLVGVLAVTQALLPALRASGGRVILMSSVSARLPMPCAGRSPPVRRPSASWSWLGARPYGTASYRTSRPGGWIG
ncbi:MAG: SDR family NAD(P)-dependent oxidoreductase [Gemmatimonadota bacterium]